MERDIFSRRRLYGLLDCHNLSQFNFEYTHQVHTLAKEERKREVETHNQRSLKLVFIVTEKSTVPPPVHNKKNKLQLSLANWLFLRNPVKHLYQCNLFLFLHFWDIIVNMGKGGKVLTFNTGQALVDWVLWIGVGIPLHAADRLDNQQFFARVKNENLECPRCLFLFSELVQCKIKDWATKWVASMHKNVHFFFYHFLDSALSVSMN